MKLKIESKAQELFSSSIIFALLLCCTMVNESIPKNENQSQSLFQKKFSEFHFPLMTMVESSILFPHSDVTCISSCARKKSQRRSWQVQLPGEHGVSRTATPSLLQQKQSTAKQKKMDKLLHDEHRNFMCTYKAEREERFKIENAASIVVQRIMRGYGVRQRLYPKRFQRTTREIPEEEVWEVLLEAISKLEIDPTKDMILGMDLPPKIASFVTFDQDP